MKSLLSLSLVVIAALSFPACQHGAKKDACCMKPGMHAGGK